MLREIREEDVKQFTTASISDPWEPGEDYTFSCSMVSACSPLFDNCDSNYAVRTRLEENGVLLHNNRYEAETSCLYVRFSTKVSAENFIDRLNAYLRERAKTINQTVASL